MFKYISFFILLTLINSVPLLGQGNFYNEGLVTLQVGSSIEIKGDAVIHQSILGDGFMVMNGDNPQQISGNSANVNNFRISNSANVWLSNPLWVNDTFQLSVGILTLNNQHLYLGDQSIAQGSAGGYVETNGTGYIQRKIDNNPFTFHTGYGNEYFPITLTEMGTADTFRLQAWDQLTANATMLGSPITNHVALLSYSFTDLIAGGNNLDITMGWNDSKNAPDFAQTHAIGVVYNGTNYVELSNCPTNVNNINPNTVSYTNINTTGTFGIGDSVYATNIPQAFIQPGDTSICAGSTITFTALPAGATSYEWSTTETTQTINTGTNNNYFVTIVDSTGCAYTSNVVTLNILPLPPTPTITYNNPTLSVDSTYAGYQWYLDGNMIAGATNYSTNFTINGIYHVVVTGANGCTATSNDFTLPLSITEEDNTKLIIWGQNNTLNIQLTNDDAQQIFIYDALGKVVYHQKYNTNTIPLQLSHGMYIVRVVGVKAEYVKKMVW